MCAIISRSVLARPQLLFTTKFCPAWGFSLSTGLGLEFWVLPPDLEVIAKRQKRNTCLGQKIMLSSKTSKDDQGQVNCELWLLREEIYIFYNLWMIKFTCHNSNDNNIEQEHFLVLFTPLKRKLMCKSTSTLVIIELAFLYTFDAVIEKVWEAYGSMLSFFNHISLLKKKNVCETFVVTGVESSPLIYSKRWNIPSSRDGI